MCAKEGQVDYSADGFAALHSFNVTGEEHSQPSIHGTLSTSDRYDDDDEKPWTV